MCPTCEAPVKNKIKIFGSAASSAVEQALSDMIKSDGWKSAMEDQNSADKLCAAQGHRIVHLEEQLAVAHDTLVEEQRVMRESLEAKTQENARLLQQHSAYLMALTASAEMRQQQVSSQENKIAELEVELTGKEYHCYNYMCAALDACKEANQQVQVDLEANAQEGARLVQQQSSIIREKTEKIFALEQMLATTAKLAVAVRDHFRLSGLLTREQLVQMLESSPFAIGATCASNETIMLTCMTACMLQKSQKAIRPGTWMDEERFKKTCRFKNTLKGKKGRHPPAF